MDYNIDILVAGCNTNCQHCYVDGGPGPAMKFEDFQKSLNHLLPIMKAMGNSFSFTLDNELYNHPLIYSKPTDEGI